MVKWLYIKINIKLFVFRARMLYICSACRTNILDNYEK